MAKVDYENEAKDFAFGQLLHGEDYTTNLGQVNNLASRISAANNLSKEEVYDNLLSQIKKLQERGYNPILNLIKYYWGTEEE